MSQKKSELGIGQPSMVSYRYSLVDYLHWMYVYEFLISTIKPKEVSSLETLLYPFDFYVWIFTIASVIAVLMFLIIAQNLWQSSSSLIESNSATMFQGNTARFTFTLGPFTNAVSREGEGGG